MRDRMRDRNIALMIILISFLLMMIIVPILVFNLPPPTPAVNLDKPEVAPITNANDITVFSVGDYILYFGNAWHLYYSGYINNTIIFSKVRIDQNVIYSYPLFLDINNFTLYNYNFTVHKIDNSSNIYCLYNKLSD